MINVKRKLLMRAITLVIAFAVVLGGFTLLANRGLEGASAAPIVTSGPKAENDFTTFEINEDNFTLDVKIHSTRGAVNAGVGNRFTIVCYENVYNSWSAFPSTSQSKKIINLSWNILSLVDGTAIAERVLDVSIPLSDFEIDFSSYGNYSFVAYYYTTQLAQAGVWYINKFLSYTVNPIVELPPDPVKSGYDFVGWYYDSAFTQPYQGAPITSTTNLYARFTPITYNITYNLNGGGISGQTTSYNIESNTITLTIPSRNGYTFGGWFVNSNFSGSPVTTIANGSTGHKTFYAKWDIILYSITYHLNNGELIDEPKNYTIATDTITLPTPIRAGHTFLGWYANENLSGTPITTIAKGSMGNKVFYADWEIDIYVVTFVTHSPVDVDFIQEIEYLGKVAQPDLLTREGYDFKGWFRDPACTIVFNFSDSIVQDTTLYAKWEVRKYIVTFYIDDGNVLTFEVEHGTILTDNKALSALLRNSVGPYTDNNLNFAFDMNTLIESDIVLYSQVSSAFQNWITFGDFLFNYWQYLLIGLGLVIIGVFAVVHKVRG